ncbi:APG12-domain-containing protein [Aspergillus sclerotioniger CBS 115572]|uniref:Ubiquitin-like protein ATG12 n=1 Tax=Aspergillus sclerotioniger CBS 115572 TaxID=1450535 RepID=A0A317WCW3_9EURO|nr:APG12-domain-containing protein [Aspergillus sclerotioniger CBS 115572]PWY83755.1 APG12-domain-containing protein [Aspergillus sclerotioniger CBS 115572]
MEPSSSQGPSAQNSPKPDQTSLTHRPANRKQSSDSASNTQNAPIPDDKQGADLPMTMSASVVLTSLPRDAHQALADAEAVDTGKGKCNSGVIMLPSSSYVALELSRFYLVLGQSSRLLTSCDLSRRANTNVVAVTVRFQPLPSAPILKNRVFKISASQKFETVVKFLRKKLDCKESDSVFCYVNSVFAPGLDEGVGGLWRCFKTDEQLIVAYSMTPAFG